MDSSSQDRTRDQYEDDFYGWTQTQAQLLRAGQTEMLDVANLIEEIESLGRSQLSALRSSYRLIALHLLRLTYQPSHKSDSWLATIVRERDNVEDILEDNPGLRPRRPESLARAYPKARREAASETKLSLATFPEDSPFALDEIAAHDYCLRRGTIDDPAFHVKRPSASAISQLGLASHRRDGHMSGARPRRS